MKSKAEDMFDQFKRSLDSDSEYFPDSLRIDGVLWHNLELRPTKGKHLVRTDNDMEFEAIASYDEVGDLNWMIDIAQDVLKQYDLSKSFKIVLWSELPKEQNKTT